MKHKAELSISRPSFGDGKEKIKIEIRDTDARIAFVEVEVDYATFTECLTGLSRVDCDMEVRGLCNVGKQRITKSLEFKIPKPRYAMKDIDIIEIAESLIPIGWSSYFYFGSKDSFFMKDGEDYARTQISKWVDK